MHSKQILFQYSAEYWNNIKDEIVQYQYLTSSPRTIRLRRIGARVKYLQAAVAAVTHIRHNRLMVVRDFQGL